MADAGSIDSILQSFYEVISGSAGQKRDWGRLRSLFVPGAILVPSAVVCGTAPLSAFGVDAYVQRLEEFLGRNDFCETGAVARVDTFGNMASVLSTYEARRKPDDPLPFRQGVNYVQLLNDGHRWWVTSMIWRDEDQANPIPAELRPATGRD